MNKLVNLLIPLFLATGSVYAQTAFDGDLNTVAIDHYNFSNTDKDASIWSAMYIASNDKIYIGLCTHADVANVYEFDTTTRKMKQLANLTQLLDERCVLILESLQNSFSSEIFPLLCEYAFLPGKGY